MYTKMSDDTCIPLVGSHLVLPLGPPNMRRCSLMAGVETDLRVSKDGWKIGPLHFPVGTRSLNDMNGLSTIRTGWEEKLR